MEYKVNGIPIDVNDVIVYLQKGYRLHVCKIIQEKSGCTLAQARDLYHEMLQGEGIQESPITLEMREYLRSEYEDNDD